MTFLFIYFLSDYTKMRNLSKKGELRFTSILNSSDQILGLLLKKERKPFLDLGLDIWVVTAIDGMIADFVQIPFAKDLRADR